MRIGNYDIKNGLIFPPVAGYSDAGMRKLCYRYGAGLCFTEMVSAKGLVYGGEGSRELLYTSEEEPIKAVQLFGREEDFIARAVRHEALSKFQMIDINFGCPVPKVVKNGEGSALLKEPGQIYRVIKAAVDAADGRIVTGKIRAGFTRGEHLAVEAALAIQEAGGAMVTVHGRTRDMLYSGRADLGVIKDVKDALRVPVVGNGDVVDRKSYLEMLSTGVDGVAIARGAFGRPYIFAEVLGQSVSYDIVALVREHLDELLKAYPERVAVNNIKKHVVFYVKGIRGGKVVKENVFRAETAGQVMRALTDVLPAGQIRAFSDR